MSVKTSLADFCRREGLWPKDELCEITTEYKNDIDPQVYILKSIEGKSILRLRIQTDRINAVATEFTVCRILQENGFSDFYPQLIGSYSEVPEIGSVAVTSYIDGISLDKIIGALTLDDCHRIADNLNDILHQIHSVQDNSFHGFTKSRFDSWHEFFETKLDVHLNRALSNKTLSLHDIHLIRSCLHDKRQLLQDKQSCLLHFDIKPANIIYHAQSGKVALIDFEMSRFGDVLFEFTKGEFASVIAENPKYDKHIWNPLVESYLGVSHNEFVSSEIFAWYSLYHYLAYSNYTRFIDGKLPPVAAKRLGYLIQRIMG